jgi:hypothetical protein
MRRFSEKLGHRPARLLFGGVALVVAVALVVLVVTYVSNSSHSSACQQYKDALTLALNDPLGAPDNAALDSLSPSDRVAIQQARAGLQREVTPTTAASCDFAGDPACLVPGSQESEQQGLSRWEAGVPKLEALLLAQRNC